MKILNIHVVVSKETIPYFNYQINNMKKSSRYSERLFFFCYARDEETNSAFANDPQVTIMCFDL